MRLFLAINLDDDARRAVYDATAALRAEAPELSWTREAKLHLTLRFLGEQPDDSPPRLAEAADEVARRHRGFRMRLRQVGAFPNFRRARVVWLGVDPDPRLELLHHDVELACDARGFGLEGRPFRPHVTLARVRQHAPEEILRRLARCARATRFERDVPVTSVDVMRSALTPRGSEYERLHAAPLGSA